MACTVVLLCGPPASGKSEMVRALTSQIPRSTSLVFDDVFTSDEQQRAIHVENGFKNLRERFLKSGVEVLDRVTGLRDDYGAMDNCTETSSSYVVIVEDNFYRRSMRYKWFQEIRDRNLSFCTVFFTTPMEDCLRRNRQRAQPVPESVIREQFSKLELPGGDENFWEKFSLVEASPTVEDVLALISSAEESPFSKLDLEGQSEETEKARQQTRASKLHQMDLAFRRAVSVLVKNAPSADRKTLYARLNLLKSSVTSSEELIRCSGGEIDAQVVTHLKRKLLENE